VHKENSSGLFKAYIILAAMTLFAFWPALFAGYLNWDDPSIFFNNPWVFGGGTERWWRIFLDTDSHNQTYIPLTILSFVLEHKLFGVSAFASHLINLLLHVACVWLVLVLALRLGFSRITAFLVALVFAVHPMRVESVAWVTERKDVLFGVFYLGALVAYWDHVKGNGRGKYLLALLCGVASVLAKPMALSLPLALFLLDERSGRRWTASMLWDKVPFAVAIWPVAGITFVMNSHPMPLSWPESYAILAWSATFYIVKFFWPLDLLVFYPAPGVTQFTEAAVLLIIVGLVTWLLRRDRWWRFALLFYGVTMFFMWRMSFEDGARGLVHDRFMYIPGLGFMLCLGAWLDRWRADDRFKRWGRATWAGIAIMIAFLAGSTFSKCFVWQNSWTYWQEVLDRAPNNYFARLNRAVYLVEGDAQKIFGWSKQLRLQIARRDLERAILIAPKDPDVWRNFGIVLTGQGDYAKAEEALKEAVRLAPVKAAVYNDWGNYYFRRGDWQKALRSYNHALKLKPSFSAAVYNRSLLFRWLRENLPPSGEGTANEISR
jgi:protein O-mannosyl-transferase